MNGQPIRAAGSCLLIQCLLTACRPVHPVPITAERLVRECARSMGGVERIASLRTMRLAHHYPDHGTIRYEISRPNRVRSGDVLVFDGQRASWLPGTNSDGTPRLAELVPQEEWKDFEEDIAWNFPAFFDYPAEYAGTETVGTVDTHKLQVTLPLGTVMTYYLDARTHLVLMAATRHTLNGTEYRPERTYSDYRTVAGVLYPHAFTYRGRTGVFTATAERIEFNVPLGSERFAIPTARD